MSPSLYTYIYFFSSGPYCCE